jgi:non-homologous end joining protein Ku
LDQPWSNAGRNELELATTLVEQMATTLPEIDTEDNYFNALRTLVDSKIHKEQTLCMN